jgi:hypothetical protein
MQPDDPKPLPEKAVWAMRSRESGSISSSDSWNTAPTGTDVGDEDDEDVEHWAQSADDLEDAVAPLQGPAHEEEAGEGSSTSFSWTHVMGDNIAISQEAGREDEVVTDPDCVAQDDLIYRGRIEAIKLTGDPNIPRGEYTFIAPDIGPNGLVRVATEEMFRGARIVKSVGHIAARGFRDGAYCLSCDTYLC